jgi:hypothetical protein
MSKNKFLKQLMSCICLVVFAVSMAVPRAVYAEDDPTQEPQVQETAVQDTGSTPELTPEPTDAPVVDPTEEPADPTMVPTEVQAEDEQPPVVEEPQTDPDVSAPEGGDGGDGSEPETPVEVIEQLPEGVDLVVLDENGEPVPLISTEAEEIIALPDPSYTCSNGVERNFDSINEAIADMTTYCIGGGNQVNGSLTIAAGTFNEVVVLNTAIAGFTSIVGAGSGATTVSSLTLLDQSAMSITGLNILNYLMLNGLGTGDLALEDITLFNSSYDGIISVSQSDWDHDITLTDVIVDGDTDGSDYGTDNSGISTLNGDEVTLTNVQSYHNETGAILDGANSVLVQQTGDGISAFDNNLVNGINVSEVYYEDQLLGQPVTPGPGVVIQDTSIDGNGDVGLVGQLLYDGITLDNVTIDDNGDAGLLLETTGDVTITDSSVSGNNWDVDELYNTIYDAQDVTISDSHFDDNGDAEDEIGGFGLVVDWGDYFDEMSFDTEGENESGDLTVTDSTFSNNTEVGLVYDGEYYVTDDGWYNGDSDVSLDGVTANSNGAENIIIFNADDVDVNDTTVNDSGQTYGDGRGLNIDDVDNVTISNLTASGNAWDNIGVGDFDSVSITDTTTTDSYCDGIYLYDGYDVFMNHVNSNDNGWGDGCTGALLEDIYGDITVNNSEFSGNNYAGFEMSYTDGNHTFENVEMVNNGDPEDPDSDYGYGLISEYSYGDFDISNSTFDENMTGIALFDAEEGTLTIEDTTMNGNEFTGLVVISGDVGAGFLENNPDGPELAVNITCSSASNNGAGIVLLGVGDVKLDGVTYTGNDEFDLIVDNNGQYVELSGCKGSSGGTPDKPSGKIVDVTGDQLVPVDCDYAWTKLIIDNGDYARFEGFCDLNAKFTHIESTSLPGALPEGYTYAGGFGAVIQGLDTTVIPDSGYASLSLVQPTGLEGKSLVILYWDAGAGKWIEVPVVGSEGSFDASNPAMKVLSGVKIGADGKIDFSVNFTGTFIIVTK